MVAVAETLLTAVQSDRRTRRRPIPRLWVPSEACWRFENSPNYRVTLAAAIGLIFPEQQHEQKIVSSGRLNVFFFTENQSVMLI